MIFIWNNIYHFADLSATAALRSAAVAERSAAVAVRVADTADVTAATATIAAAVAANPGSEPSLSPSSEELKQ